MKGKTTRRVNLLAGAVVVHDGLFLLLKRSSSESFLPDVWGIPAGHLQRGEDPSAACLRELREETGLQGRLLEPIGSSCFSSSRGSTEPNNLQFNYLVDVTEDDVNLDRSSHSEYRWISLDDENNSLLDRFTQDIVANARRRYKEIGEHGLVNR